MFHKSLNQVCPSIPRPREPGATTDRGPLQRRGWALRHLHCARPDTTADPEVRRGRHIRDRVRDEEREGVDGADGAAVHLHPPVPPGGPRGQGTRGTQDEPSTP